jgi:hypothetical protein
METIHGFDFYRLHFDADGNIEQQHELDEFKQNAPLATDAILISHGFRNDEEDATGLYTRFLETFRHHVDGSFKPTLGTRKFIIAGIYWPSKAFPENVRFDGSTAAIEDELLEKEKVRAQLLDLRETIAAPEQRPSIDLAIDLLDHVKGGAPAQNQFVASVLKLLDRSEPDPNEGAEKIRLRPGVELLQLLETPLRNPVTVKVDDEGGTAGVAGVFTPLRMVELRASNRSLDQYSAELASS